MRRASKPPATGLRLLLIDDNSRGLLARRVILEEQGYIVTSCSNPEDALEQFASQLFDIVVTDYRMPNMDGIQLLARFRAIRSVPIVLISCMVGTKTKIAEKPLQL